MIKTHNWFATIIYVAHKYAKYFLKNTKNTVKIDKKYVKNTKKEQTLDFKGRVDVTEYADKTKKTTRKNDVNGDKYD